MFLCYPFSDGMSRTGVFITCMCEIERVKVEGGVDIFQTVKAARAQRPHMVYTSVRNCQNLQNQSSCKYVHILSLAWVSRTYQLLNNEALFCIKCKLKPYIAPLKHIILERWHIPVTV